MMSNTDNPPSPPQPSVQVSDGNTSGLGKNAAIPDGVRGWSWGALLLNWIWAIGNRTWIGLLCLVPYLGFVMAIVLGFKGREWAWRSKRWESVDHFNKVQKRWSFWGVLLVVVVIAAAIVIPAFVDHQRPAQTSRQR